MLLLPVEIWGTKWAANDWRHEGEISRGICGLLRRERIRPGRPNGELSAGYCCDYFLGVVILIQYMQSSVKGMLRQVDGESSSLSSLVERVPSIAHPSRTGGVAINYMLPSLSLLICRLRLEHGDRRRGIP